MGNASQSVYARALHRAADILGGKDKLRAALHVPAHSLDEWLEGRSEPPMDIFLKAVDILSAPLGSASATAATLRARALIRDAERTMARSRTLTDAHRTARERHKLLANFLVATFRPQQRAEMLGSALDAALEAAHAPMGNVQLKGDDGLRIVAQRGVAQPFPDFFNYLTDARSRIVVSDITTHPEFANSEAAKVLAAAGVRAVQSTPLISVTGNVLGMLSTHYDHPGERDPAELEAIDLIASRAAYWLDQPTA